jgi:hypothetical protein
LCRQLRHPKVLAAPHGDRLEKPLPAILALFPAIRLTVDCARMLMWWVVVPAAQLTSLDPRLLSPASGRFLLPRGLPRRFVPPVISSCLNSSNRSMATIISPRASLSRRNELMIDRRSIRKRYTLRLRSNARIGLFHAFSAELRERSLEMARHYPQGSGTALMPRRIATSVA